MTTTGAPGSGVIMNRKPIITAVAAAGLVIALIALAACSSSSDSKSSSSTPTTTTKDAVCADRTALATSVKTLADPDTLSGGKTAITAAAKQVKSDLDSLGKSVEADLKPQVADVKSALSGVESALGDFGNGDLSKNLQNVGNAIAKVGTTSADLASALATRCPSS